MKTAKELYPEYAKEEEEYDCFYGPSDYQPILDEFGEILVQVDDDDYQGDSRVLYRDGTRYGWLQFGWSSCSGCDALQACSNIKEVQQLMDELCGNVRWFDNAAEALEFFKTHDWEGDYSWGNEEQKEFVDKVVELLSVIPAA